MNTKNRVDDMDLWSKLHRHDEPITIEERRALRHLLLAVRSSRITASSPEYDNQAGHAALYEQIGEVFDAHFVNAAEVAALGMVTVR